MKTSETVVKIFSALLEAQKEFPSIPKNRTAKVKTKTGAEYSYKYADISDILHVIVPILNKHGIAFSQPHILADGRARVATQLMHSSGEWMQSDGLPLGEFVNPQELGGSSTYMRRYEACSVLGIVAEDDSDAQELAPSRQVSRPTVVQPRKVEPINSQGDAFEPGGPVFDDSGDMVEAQSTVLHREVKASKPTKEDRKEKGWISEGQEKRFWFFVKQSGLEQAEVKSYLTSLGVTDISQLPWKKYGAAVVWAGGPAEERA